jgi:hypothetical protein
MICIKTDQLIHCTFMKLTDLDLWHSRLVHVPDISIQRSMEHSIGIKKFPRNISVSITKIGEACLRATANIKHAAADYNRGSKDQHGAFMAVVMGQQAVHKYDAELDAFQADQGEQAPQGRHQGRQVGNQDRRNGDYLLAHRGRSGGA